jgi:hypothetical protein
MNSSQNSKLSSIANRLLQLALEVEDGTMYVNSHTLIKISQEISSCITDSNVKLKANVDLKANKDCWEHLKGVTGNLSPPHSPYPSSCDCTKKVSFEMT